MELATKAQMLINMDPKYDEEFRTVWMDAVFVAFLHHFLLAQRFLIFDI